MFKKNKNKRRNEDAYLSIENGEVIDLKVDNKKSKITRTRNCDDFSEEDIQTMTVEAELFDTPFTSVSDEQIFNELENKDNTVSDMKATIFNIFKFLFIFCLVAILGFIIYKTSPIFINKMKNITHKQDNIEENENSLGFIEQQKQNQEMKKLKTTMNHLNTFNDSFKQVWELLKSYCTGYSTNQYSIYIHEKNMSSQYELMQTNYNDFLISEADYKTDCDKEIFSVYKLRYENLLECLKELEEGTTYNRGTILDVVNSYLEKDNTLNKEEFDILIIYFNKLGISYEITEDKIIMIE